MYGLGRSEELAGKALAELPETGPGTVQEAQGQDQRASQAVYPGLPVASLERQRFVIRARGDITPAS